MSAEPKAPPLLSAGDALIYAFRRNVVVAASAGTGKTHRLTALYVLLTLGLTSLGRPDATSAARPILPDRIVATTFSRAAAREIAHRIGRALQQIAAWDGVAEILFADILRARQLELSSTSRDFAFSAGVRWDSVGGAEDGLQPAAPFVASHGAPSVAELRRRAAEALARFPAARIDTLHGVAKQIVDRHAIAMGFAPGARILDEEEAQALSDLAVDEVLSRALADGGERADAARALIAAAGTVDDARREITRLLDRLDEEGLSPRRLAVTDHAAEAIAVRRELHRLAAASAALGSAAFREPAAALAHALASAERADPFAAAAIDPAIALFAQRKPHKSKCTPADEAFIAFREGLPGETHRDKAHHLLSFLHDAPRLTRREAMVIELLDQVRERLAAVRRTEGGLGFGDLLRAARDGLRDDAVIGSAVRESLDVLLVDEFQDTSAVQRDLVYLLRERGDAAATREKGTAPSADALSEHGLFLVGDRKQSIYGFRGADVSIFCRVCSELAGAAAGQALELPPSSWSPRPIADFVALRESRRSTPEVLAFINAFSARDFSQGGPLASAQAGARSSAPREFEIVYSAAEQLVAVPSDARSAPTRVALIDDDGAAPEEADALVRDAKGPLREALVAAAYIARRVRGASDRPPIDDAEDSDLRFRDVAVLARRRSTIPLIELALARLDIPYVVAGRALFDAAEIRDVAAVLRLVLDPHDRLALATVLRGPMATLSDTALSILSPPGRGLTVPLLGPWPRTAAARELSRLPAADRSRVEAFRAQYAELRNAALRSTPGEAIRAAVVAFDLDRVLAALPRAEARIGNIDRLVALARKRGGSLASFVRWLERRIRDEADEPEAAVFSPDDDAVRLTTIHASKGLDFPAVVLVDLNAEPRADQPGLSFVPAAEDRPAALLMRHYARRVDRSPRPGSRYDVEVLSIAPEIAVTPPALHTARAELRARERAERQRLTYVAITRARRELVLIGSASKPRSGSAWLTLKSAAGAEGVERQPAAIDGKPSVHGGALDDTLSVTLQARGLLAEVKPPALGTDAYARPAKAPRSAPPHALATARTVAIGAAPLSLFQACPRRFRLRHLFELEEPRSDGQLFVDGPAELADEERVELERGVDSRLPGRAPHRVIERWPCDRWGEPTATAEVAARLALEGLAQSAPDAPRLADGLARFLEGPYARALREARATLHREEPFALEIQPQALGRHDGIELSLKGALDLAAEYPDGRLDILEYKRARPRGDLSAYELRLRAYALAAWRRSPGREIRVGVLFLGAHVEPVWLHQGAIPAEDHERFERELARLAEQFAAARGADDFEGVPIARCRQQHCGFIRACYGDGGSLG